MLAVGGTAGGPGGLGTAGGPGGLGFLLGSDFDLQDHRQSAAPVDRLGTGVRL